MYTSTTSKFSYKPKFNETMWLWNVLQSEDQYRLLDSADTKYDALITHIWAQNNFAALFSSTVGVADWAAQRLVFAGDMTSYARKQKIYEIPAISSKMSFDGRSLKHPHENPHMLHISRNKIHRPTFCSR